MEVLLSPTGATHRNHQLPCFAFYLYIILLHCDATEIIHISMSVSLRLKFNIIKIYIGHVVEIIQLLIDYGFYSTIHIHSEPFHYSTGIYEYRYICFTLSNITMLFCVYYLHISSSKCLLPTECSKSFIISTLFSNTAFTLCSRRPRQPRLLET